MNALATVATLDARAEFAELRRIVRIMGEHDARWLAEADGHIDRLVDLYADTLHAFDGYVTPEKLQEEVDDASSEVSNLEERLDDKEDELEHLEREVDELEDKVKEYQNVVDESADELRIQVKNLLDEQYQHEARIECERGKTVRAEKALAVYRAQVQRSFDSAITASPSKVRREALVEVRDAIRKTSES